MKTKHSALFGIIAILLAMVFTMAGCPGLRVTGEEKTIQSINISGTPAKTDYAIGEPFNLAGLTLTVTYDTGIAITADMIRPVGWNSAAGTGKALTVEYGGKSASLATITITGETAVYTVGYYGDYITSKACYWTNGVVTENLINLSNYDEAEVASIVVQGGVVHTSGYYYNGSNTVACYWAGTARTNLAVSGNAEANALAMQGSAVYIAGHYTNSGKEAACYWKDGVKTDLTASGDAKALAIAVTIP